MDINDDPSLASSDLISDSKYQQSGGPPDIIRSNMVESQRLSLNKNSINPSVDAKDKEKYFANRY